MSGQSNAVPVTIVTGFLGSGKTTMLNRLLRRPALADTVVIVNEFGEVGLDHLLIEQAIENTVLLKNGCIRRTVRGDVADTIKVLWQQRAGGVIPPFGRVVIETTGAGRPWLGRARPDRLWPPRPRRRSRPILPSLRHHAEPERR